MKNLNTFLKESLFSYKEPTVDSYGITIHNTKESQVFYKKDLIQVIDYLIEIGKSDKYVLSVATDDELRTDYCEFDKTKGSSLVFKKINTECSEKTTISDIRKAIDDIDSETIKIVVPGHKLGHYLTAYYDDYDDDYDNKFNTISIES